MRKLLSLSLTLLCLLCACQKDVVQIEPPVNAATEANDEPSVVYFFNPVVKFETFGNWETLIDDPQNLETALDDLKSTISDNIAVEIDDIYRNNIKISDKMETPFTITFELKLRMGTANQVDLEMFLKTSYNGAEMFHILNKAIRYENALKIYHTGQLSGIIPHIRKYLIEKINANLRYDEADLLTELEVYKSSSYVKVPPPVTVSKEIVKETVIKQELPPEYLDLLLKIADEQENIHTKLQEESIRGYVRYEKLIQAINQRNRILKSENKSEEIIKFFLEFSDFYIKLDTKPTKSRYKIKFASIDDPINNPRGMDETFMVKFTRYPPDNRMDFIFKGRIISKDTIVIDKCVNQDIKLHKFITIFQHNPNKLYYYK